MRPTFEVEIEDSARWLGQLREGLAAADAPCTGQVFRHHAVLQVPEGSRHLWSPHLNLELREEEGVATLHGRFSPHPNVWTAFMAIYGVLLLVALAGLVVGLSQLTLSASPWGLLVTPAAVVMAGFVYGAVFIGQGLGAEQMYELRSFAEAIEGRDAV
jgi:hypothetical protein